MALCSLCRCSAVDTAEWKNHIRSAEVLSTLELRLGVEMDALQVFSGPGLFWRRLISSIPPVLCLRAVWGTHLSGIKSSIRET